MLLSKVRSALIFIIFFGYVAIMFSVIVIWTKGGLDFDEFTTTIAIIAPLLASHIAAIIAFAQTDGDNDQRFADKTISSLNISIVLTPPTALILLLLFSLYGKGFNFIAITFEQFKVLIAAINSMFGVYVASLVSYYIKGQRPQPERGSNNSQK